MKFRHIKAAPVPLMTLLTILLLNIEFVHSFSLCSFTGCRPSSLQFETLASGANGTKLSSGSTASAAGTNSSQMLKQQQQRCSCSVSNPFQWLMFWNYLPSMSSPFTNTGPSFQRIDFPYIVKACAALALLLLVTVIVSMVAGHTIAKIRTKNVCNKNAKVWMHINLPAYKFIYIHLIVANKLTTKFGKVF